MGVGGSGGGVWSCFDPSLSLCEFLASAMLHTTSFHSPPAPAGERREPSEGWLIANLRHSRHQVTLSLKGRRLTLSFLPLLSPDRQLAERKLMEPRRTLPTCFRRVCLLPCCSNAATLL